MDTLTWLFSQKASSTTLQQLQELKFYVHDQEHTVNTSDLPPETSLNTYLRKYSHLTGTKYMCLEGGCGSCVVAATVMDPVTNREVIIAVNSCLVPIYSCSGWKIHTSESIGNEKSGYHPVQQKLVQFNGTQCGFCSSGMVMNMYALYESGNFTMKDVENSFGGNMCRCTGYRPILSAFKSLAADASSDLLGKCADIEDIRVCKKTQGQCKQNCLTPCIKRSQAHYYDFGKSRWVKVFSVNEIFDVMKSSPDASYMLVGGNTATGVYKRTKEPDVYIDITSVKTLLEHSISNDSLVLGANMSLTNAMNLFYKLAKEDSKFSYLENLGDHIDLIANVPVRNTGTLAGNIFTKHEYQQFPSDIFLILETVGATLTIVGIDQQEVTKNLVDFLSFDMKHKIIKSITLPSLDASYKYESYKIMPRAQNAHALVNAGFLLKLDDSNKVESARIVYGSINPSFIHAQNSEAYLTGKNLFENETLQGVFETLDKELVPDFVLPDPPPEFRKQLAIALMYKFILSITPDDKKSARNKSGGAKLVRPVSSGTQDYETNESLYPLTQPIPKLEALAQCSGQAKYIMDMHDEPGQLYGAFVLAKATACSVISKIDTTEALKLPGVVAFYDKNDIPGENNFMPKKASDLFSVPEEIFCSGVVKYYFQSVGLIVATSQEIAENAAELVNVSYVEGKETPYFTIREMIAKNPEGKINLAVKVEAKSKGSDVKHVIKGKFDVSWQYHYQMETQCCAVIPGEDGLDIYPSTQSLNLAQTSAANALNIPVNKINVFVRRIGGAYGSKISRNSLVSCAAAIAAYKLQKPVKLQMSLITNMNVIGKRNPCAADYEVGVDEKGSIQYLNISVYSDIGSEGGNEAVISELVYVLTFIYKSDNWNINAYYAKSDNHTATWCRAPGTVEAIGLAEVIMQHIAFTTNLDPIQIRRENLKENQADLTKHLDDLIQWADIEKRKQEIEEFNKANRWVKRGIASVIMTFPMYIFGNWYAHVSIYQGDGTVSVSHGGVEMGQGINTKAAQVCAYALGIPLNQVSVKPSNVLVTPNCMSTGGSLTSEAVAYAILKCCDTLKERIKPVKEKMKDPTWAELIYQCHLEYVDLCASYMYHAALPDVKSYPVHGATCVETEVDILTGLYQIKRVDLIEDAGNSMSPEIDIGQVEGAFIMGLGYWTSEQIIFNSEGELLTNRTWTYKPPGVKDIPVDFRVKFPKNNPNPIGVLHSKATGEPPLCMAICVPLAIRDAVASARSDADSTADRWYNIDGPSSVENTFMNSLNNYKQYTI
ncbi:hypothetical protein ILUMI_21179 [Ignelater luminosus]|uniref:Indole-3-acetaldehyde oxidase n=1 Tax=Ignelater luminosus TaxID=2038154 RepID=A0A8K0CCN9_IGNLU|nr:hypothetical protein ILUMI_21179 [Ignelater luminosus]